MARTAVMREVAMDAMVHMQDDVSFEISEEVRDKMHSADNLHELIDEHEVDDLRYVDVSKSRYRYMKRAIDIFGSLCGLIVLALPLLISVAVTLPRLHNVPPRMDASAVPTGTLSHSLGDT